VAWLSKQSNANNSLAQNEENEAARSTASTQVSEKIESVLKLDALALEVGIQRLRCNVQPCPIFGRAWYDNFTLSRH
jgi:hypothetical protein